MLICENCRAVIEDDECGTHKEDGERMSNDCSCGGQFLEAVRCEKCGDYFAKGELFGGYCHGCLEEEMTFERAIGEEDFLTSFFTKEQANEILTREARKAYELDKENTLKAVKAFYEEDLEYLAYKLDEEG